jgi:uncharacterized delta-60 repeat protein
MTWKKMLLIQPRTRRRSLRQPMSSSFDLTRRFSFKPHMEFLEDRITPQALSLTVNDGSSATINYGQTAALAVSATGVSSSATPTGNNGDTIQIIDNNTSNQLATTPASATLSVSGTTGSASLTSSATLAAGSYAPYAHDTNTTATVTDSNHTADTLTVLADSTSAVVTPSDASPVSGESVSFTAVISNTNTTGRIPTGAVQFQIDGHNFGNPFTLPGGSGNSTIVTSGTTSFTLASGNHSIAAVYTNSDGNFSNSSGSVNNGTYAASQASTTTSDVTNSGANPSVFGQAVTFTVTVSAQAPGNGTPTGTVAFDDGGVSIGTGTLSSGTATFSSSGLSVASHTITAVYGGDTEFTSSNDSSSMTPLVQVVKPPPGTLVSSFGTGGIANVSLSASLPTEDLKAIAIEPNGEILAAGGANYGGNGGAFALALFQVNGTLDPSFGNGGVVLTPFNANGGTYASAIALEPNGQIVLAGTVGLPGGLGEFALARYNADGTLDSTFGANGLVTTPVDGNSWATGVAIDANGNIIVAGGAGQAYQFESNFALARYTSNGVLDTTFGNNGTVETNLGPTDASAQGLALQADGKIVVVGHTSTSSGNFHFAVLRYSTDGTLDTSFNGTGEVLDNFPGEYAGFQGDDARAVAIQADGKIVVTGNFAGQGLVSNVALARYNSDGSPDTTFNGTGKTSLLVGNDDAGDGLTLQGNGKIIVTGSEGVAGGSPMLTIRYNADGTLDTGFGTNGIVTTKLSSDGNDEAHGAVQVQPDGDIVIGGTAGIGNTDSNFALVRYVGDPAINSTGVNGNATAQVPFKGDVATFTTADSNLKPGQFAVTINWGDHTTSNGTVVTHTGGGFDVTGSHTYAAIGSYSPSVTINGPMATSATRKAAITVKYAASSTLAKASVNPAVFGQRVTFTATVQAGSGASGLPTGSVVFKDGATVLGTAVLSSGMATFSTASLARASHTITVSYGGDRSFSASASAAFAENVVADATVANASSSLSSTVFGQRVTFTVVLKAKAPGSGTPTGLVTFKDGTTGLGRATLQLVGGLDRATLSTAALSVGSHTITAIYQGDGTFAGSSSSAPVVVNKASSRTLLTASPAPAVFGQVVSFTVAVLALAPGQGTPTGTVAFTDGSTTIATLTLNSVGRATFTTASLSRSGHTISANYGGDGHFLASAYPNAGLNVLRDATTSTVTPSANPAVLGQTLTLTATVQASAPGSGTPTGTVVFKDITTVLGTATLNGSGQATFSTSGLAVGTHAITATYGGDTNFTSDVSPIIAEVVKASGAGPVSSPPPPTVFGGTASVAQTVKKDAPSIVLKSNINLASVGQTITFTAVVSALAPGAGRTSGTVTFMDGSATLGLAPLGSGGSATFSTAKLSVGNHSITAIYSGDGDFTGDRSAPLDQTVEFQATAVFLGGPTPGEATPQWLLALDATEVDGFFASLSRRRK